MTEAQLRAYEAEIAALHDCESLALIGRVEYCEIGNFPVIASPDKAPVAYVADEQNARFFASAPKLVGELCAEVRRLQAESLERRDTGRFWLIFYEDADMTPQLFTSESAARETFRDRLENWSCHLFRQADVEAKP